MKFLFLLLTVVSLQVFAEDFKETITISKKNASLKEIFRMVQKQSDYSFAYTDPMLSRARLVDIDVKNAGIEQVLSICFREQPLEYEIDNSIKVIIVKEKQDVIKPNVLSIDPPKGILSVKGKVTDEAGIPIARTSVIVKGSTKATATDNRGEFSLNELEEESVLIFSCVGYERQELPVKGNTSVSAKLKVAINSLDEAVVVAYGTSSQRINTGAVTVVKGEQIQNLPNRSFDRSLQGLVPGLLVTQGTGQPGAGTSNFVLRGIATSAEALQGSTVRNPLIIIDGIPVTQDHTQLAISNRGAPTQNPLAQLNPSDIETVSVLKDAAAIALYGAKASNGVILIATKRGKTGKTRFNFRHQTDISTAIQNGPDLMNQQEYLELLYETYKNTSRVVGGVSSPWTDADILSDLRKKFPIIVKAPGDTSFYSQGDWVGELYNDKATTISNELSVSGGSDKSNFYLNFEYTKQNGVLRSTGFDRKSVRLNFENRPTSWLKLGINSILSYSIQDYGGASVGSNPAGAAFSMSPLNPIRYTNGDYVLNYPYGGAANNILNPVAAAEYNSNQNTAYRGLSKFYGEVSFLKYFRFSSSLGADFMLAETKEKADPRLIDPGLSNTVGGRVEEQDTRRFNLITTNILRFDQTFKNDHSIGLVAGHEAQILNQKVLALGVQGLTSPYYDQISSPGVTVIRQSGYVTKETLLSYFGQANYSFRSRYLLSASIRTDGSSRFGADKRFGTYWSTGAGWVVSSEPFMKSTSSWLNHLKIRGSLGEAGNAGAIDRFTPYTRIGVARYLGNTAVLPNGVTVGNSDIEWENTLSWDAGIEIRLFKERIALAADIYKRNTSNLIYSVDVPLSTGNQIILDNIGEMQNKGIELSISAYLIRNRDFTWAIDANWSTNKNTLIKSTTALATLVEGVTANQEGKNFNSFYMVRWAGVNPSDGTPHWIDSTGKPNSIFSAAKKDFVGKPQPDGFGSITNRLFFRGIELSMMFYYQYGYQIYNNASYANVTDGYLPYKNAGKNSLNRWQKPGDIAVNPKRVLNNKAPTSIPSTRYMYDGDHIRLQNVIIAYNFPHHVTSRLHLSNLKMFIQGSNLALWRTNTENDPALVDVTGLLRDVYPMERSFSIGVNINF